MATLTTAAVKSGSVGKARRRVVSSKRVEPVLVAPIVENAEAEEKSQACRLWRQGIAPGLIGRRLGWNAEEVRRVVAEERARKILEAKVDFIPSPEFDDPSAKAAINGPLPLGSERVSARPKPPEGLPPYLAELYDAPLLTREQERHLFRKMNYLKSRAAKLVEKLDPERATFAELDEIDHLKQEALEVKNVIISANLRLVVSIAKKYARPTQGFFELVSDGNMSLIRAVEKFDYARGNKFSTYASWAIMRNYSRTIPQEDHRRDRFVTGRDEMFEDSADRRDDENDREAVHRRMREAVANMLGRLDDREQRIIVSRFGLGGEHPQTLEQLGREMGITKERVRQIESRAQRKLRALTHGDWEELGLD
ncbi:MAG: hypothetical protein NVSMB14_06120 [Isosphaeraceae bacterium]